MSNSSATADDQQLVGRLDDIIHVVPDPLAIEKLRLIGLSALPSQSIEGVVRTADIRSSDPVLILGTADPELRHQLAGCDNDVYLLEDVNPAIVLAGLDEQSGEDEVEAAFRTWGAHVQRARPDPTPPLMTRHDGWLVEAAEPKRPHGSSWPKPLSEDVRLGILGRLLDAVEQETEADPAAITFDFVTRLGNLVGRGPHVTVSGDRHGCNLFVLLVGDTSQGRKGTSAAYPNKVAQRADEGWRPRSGLASGEGLIHAVRDERETGRSDSDGNPIIEPGVDDKRLLVVEPEFARVLRTSARKENTLSPLIRQAWEGSSLATMTRQPYQATEPHISIIGHVTPAELTSLLSANDIAGGTGNRFLLVATRRQRELPFGGKVPEHVLDGLGRELADVIDFGAYTNEMGFTAAAADRWPHDYRSLLVDEQQPGIAGAMLGRGAAQVRRLSMILALCEKRRDVDAHHVAAAMELWRYAANSVRHVFGIRTGNRIADRLLDELQIAPDFELDRTAIRQLFHNAAAAEIEAALCVLHDAGLAAGRKIPTGGPGRPREVWRLIGARDAGSKGAKGANLANSVPRSVRDAS